MTQVIDHAEAVQLLQAMPLGLITTNQERIVWINQQAELLVGLNAQALIGQPIEALPVWLKAIFHSGKEQSLMSGEPGCVVMASLKKMEANSITTACFLSDSNEIKQLRDRVQELEKQLEFLGTKDESSGLLNQRGLYQVVESQVSRSRRYGNALSLISMQINDYGIDSKDKTPVREALGYLFNDRLRWADSVGRTDEDEFILVLPETDSESAAILATKLATEIKTLRLRDVGAPIVLGASFGIAAWQEGDDPSRLLLRCQEDRQ